MKRQSDYDNDADALLRQADDYIEECGEVNSQSPRSHREWQERRTNQL